MTDILTIISCLAALAWAFRRLTNAAPTLSDAAPTLRGTTTAVAATNIVPGMPVSWVPQQERWMKNTNYYRSKDGVTVSVSMGAPTALRKDAGRG